jgi:septal ring factor EnvC (AmiA/AmiB activator)
MKHVISLIVLIFSFSFAWSQSSEKLKKEQERLDKKISNTKSLLNKTKNQSKSTLNELRLAEKQLEFRESLLDNINHQIRGAELKIAERDIQVKQLAKRIVKMKEQYRKMLLYAYKHRNNIGKVMYIFSANNYFEAIRRKKYLERIGALQKKQFLIIKQNEKLIREEIHKIESDKTNKQQLVVEKQKEKEEILQDKKRKEDVYNKIKGEENKLLAQLNEDERKKAQLKQKIANAIQKEIAEAEAKRKKAEAAEKTKATTAKTSSGNKGTSTTNKKTTETSAGTAAKTIKFEETKELSLNNNFESNKGRLPWPVTSGTITENFGKNPHASLKDVYTNNNGLDIAAPKSSSVRAIFEGEVTSIVSIPGAGKLVIIKHGNYRSVYCNLLETFVSIGSKVSTKQQIGKLLVKDGEGVSVLHFELHVVNGNNVQVLNPNGWIAR